MAANLRLEHGNVLNELHFTSIRSNKIRIPDPEFVIHLQFRRFAGCPLCDLHLHSIARRYQELAAASLREVVVFHSTRDDLLPYCEDLPFEIIADPEKRVYRQFGVESGTRALLSPRVWMSILRGICRSAANVLVGRAPLPSLNPRGGRWGLPADFLIGQSGTILACKYGSHAYDQWSVDEILALSRAAQSRSALASPPSRDA